MTATRHAAPLVIAHRGACSYLPEHTLAAKALAFGLGADYLEQDVVATRDDELVVLHDIHLDTVCDVAEKFPQRAREDGSFYVRDFTIAELRTLNIHERRNADGETAVFPGRFPTNQGHFSVATLAEEIEMIQGLNRATGRNAGIYPEIKHPEWHYAEGVDLSSLVLDTLNRYGYTEHEHAAYVQCFHAGEVARIRQQLGCRLKLIQLIDSTNDASTATDYQQLKTPAGLRAIAEYADGVGPWVGDLYRIAEIDGHPVSTGFVKAAHAEGLAVHPYTFRADSLSAGFESFDELVQWFVETLAIDGLFTDFTDLAIAAIKKMK